MKSMHRGGMAPFGSCRMFNQARTAQPLRPRSAVPIPSVASELALLEIAKIKTVPCVPCSHPFVERLIGTVRREYLDQPWFWNQLDLQRKLARFARYYNQARVHSALSGKTWAEQRGRTAPQSPCYGSSPGKNTVMACSTHRSPLD